MQYRRVRNLNKVIGPIERECVPYETEVGRGGATLERAVIRAKDCQCVPISGPPTNQPIWSRETARTFYLKSRERGARQKKQTDAPFPTDLHIAVYRAHLDTSHARKNVIKVLHFISHKTL